MLYAKPFPRFYWLQRAVYSAHREKPTDSSLELFAVPNNEKMNRVRFIKPGSLHHFAGTAYRAPETLLKQSYGTVNGYVRVLCEPQY